MVEALSPADILNAEIERIQGDIAVLDRECMTAFTNRDPSLSELTAAWSILNHDLAEVKEALRHV